MSSLFVITASDADAKQHVRDTIEKQIAPEKVERHFSGDELRRVREIGDVHGYYAWGAIPGSRNERNWKALNDGDHILLYQDGTYTYCARVMFKAHNKEFARENWGHDKKGKTGEYMYLLDRPVKIAPPIPATRLSPHLLGKFQGFQR